MKRFFKKYGITLFFITAITLQFLYVDNQQSRYLDSDNRKIKEGVFIALLTLLSAFAVFMFIVWIKQGIKVKDLLSGLIGIPGACIGFYFFLQPFFLSGAYFINGLFVLEQIDKPYKVVYVDPQSKALALLNLQTHNVIWNKKLLIDSTHQEIALKDTVQVIYKKGLLGFYFDPKIN